VFGMCQEGDNGVVEARYFVVEKKDRKTLYEIIEREIEVGTEIHSDEGILRTKHWIRKVTSIRL